MPGNRRRFQPPARASLTCRRGGSRAAAWSIRTGPITIPSFRGAQARTRYLEIPRCAIAHRRSGPSDHPGM